MGGIRHKLCYYIGFRIAKVQCPAHIPDSATGGHRTKGSDLGHMFLAVLFHNVVDDLATALLTEVCIKVRHADTLRI